MKHEDLNFQKLADRIVDKFYISDEEWKEILREVYREALAQKELPFTPEQISFQGL